MSTQDLFELIKNKINDLSIESCGDEGRPFRSVVKRSLD